MLKRIRKNIKGQNTAEYAILISLVVAGIIAMQTYAQRALQAKVRDASAYMSKHTATDFDDIEADGIAWKLDDTEQYEPYYLKSDYNSERYSTDTKIINGEAKEIRSITSDTSTRQKDGFQASEYDAEATDVFGAEGEFGQNK